MYQVLWRPSPLFGGSRGALHWWRNAARSELPTRGFVWIVHGIGEHGARYDEMARYLAQLGFDVLAPDLPGHGLSAKEGGQRRLSSIEESIEELRGSRRYWTSDGPIAKRGLAHTPWYLLGHSLGALTALSWILAGKGSEDEPDFAARAFVSAPPLKLRLPVPVWKIALAQALFKVAPDFRLRNEIDPAMLSYDAGNVARYRADPLVHPWATPRQFLSMVAASDRLLEQPQNIEIPLSVAVGADDPIVDQATARAFYERLGTHKQYIEFPHAKHEIFNDVDRARCYAAVAQWFV